MAIITRTATIQAGLSYLNKGNTTYVAIGKKTAWPNESAVPAENEDTRALQEVIGYKKVSNLSFCRELAAEETSSYPTVTYKGKSFILVPTDKAYQENVTGVYFEAQLNPEDFPLGTYRQVGVFQDLQPKSGVNKQALLPSEVQSAGNLILYANKQQLNRTEDSKVTERFVLTIAQTSIVD